MRNAGELREIAAVTAATGGRQRMERRVVDACAGKCGQTAASLPVLGRPGGRLMPLALTRQVWNPAASSWQDTGFPAWKITGGWGHDTESLRTLVQIWSYHNGLLRDLMYTNSQGSHDAGMRRISTDGCGAHQAPFGEAAHGHCPPQVRSGSPARHLASRKRLRLR